MRARSGGDEVRSDDRDCDGREGIFWPLWRVTRFIAYTSAAAAGQAKRGVVNYCGVALGLL